jgi:hypothetical protein
LLTSIPFFKSYWTLFCGILQNVVCHFTRPQSTSLVPPPRPPPPKVRGSSPTVIALIVMFYLSLSCVSLGWMSLRWVWLCWVSLCWVSLCWVSLCLVLLCWVSWHPSLTVVEIQRNPDQSSHFGAKILTDCFAKTSANSFAILSSLFNSY